MSEIDRVGIVGAGFMGSGIAESAARGGVEVLLYEPEREPLDRSRESVAASVARAVAADKLKAAEGEALTGRIGWTTDLDELGRM